MPPPSAGISPPVGSSSPTRKPSEAAAPRSAYAPRRLKGEWRRRARWFSAEFLVVSGVLVALALNAWWADRQDLARERAYLHPLLADTRENERRLDAAIAEESVSTLSAARAVAALHGIEPLRYHRPSPSCSG